jgi:hypothetical protein
LFHARRQSVCSAPRASRAGRARESPPPTALAVTHGHDPHQRNPMEEPGPPPPAGAPHQHQSPLGRSCGLFGRVEFCRSVGVLLPSMPSSAERARRHPPTLPSAAVRLQTCRRPHRPRSPSSTRKRAGEATTPGPSLLRLDPLRSSSAASASRCGPRLQR